MTTAFHAPAGATDLPIEDIPEVLTQGGDWDDVLHEIEAITSERIVVNLGPVHPATHGVLRLILELDGEKVRETRIDTGYLHTGIEKNMEYRTWTQGVAYCTRMDYVAPFFQEAAYCLGVEKLLGIEEDIPERASLIRILMMELCRIASHLVAIGSTGNEMGATTIMTIGFRAREEILRIFERITGLPLDLRKSQPYCGYENFEFDIPTRDKSDVYNRTMVRFDECYESMRIIWQVLDKLDQCEGAPTMVADPEIAWPARLAVATDGQGNSFEHVREIMGESMESLIHHFKLVTEGFHVPAGQVYQTVEHAKGILGVHLVSDGGTRPFRAHFRDPSFANLQALAMMTEGGQLADVVVALAAIDPVLGGVDR